jgi:D-glycero-D-manno-heptose 1,7-bisphosphate phosphatase
MTGAPGLILDRDGVINIDTGYLYRIEECRFVDGIFELAAAFRDRGFRLAIATNQSGIGRGYFEPADFRRLMAWMLARFRDHGLLIEGVYHAPDHPTEGIGRYRRDTPWRKPGPGMLRQAIADLGLDPAQSWAIGDKQGDMIAAAAAGIGQRVLFEPALPGPARFTGDHWIVPSLAAIVLLLDASGSDLMETLKKASGIGP